MDNDIFNLSKGLRIDDDIYNLSITKRNMMFTSFVGNTLLKLDTLLKSIYLIPSATNSIFTSSNNKIIIASAVILYSFLYQHYT